MGTSRKSIRNAVWAFSLSSLVGIPAASGFVLGPTSPGKWGPPEFGTGATITYSYQTIGFLDASPAVDLETFMPVGYMAEIEAAFDAWASVADLTFIEVGDSDLPFNHPLSVPTGDIRIAGEFLGGPHGTLAHGFSPPTNGATAAGDIHFDKDELWKIGFGGPGIDIFQVFAHELGHALGLGHTSVPGSLMNPFYSEAFSGPQADDLAGVISIYGPVAVAISPVPESGSTLLLLSLVLLALRVASRRR